MTEIQEKFISELSRRRIEASLEDGGKTLRIVSTLKWPGFQRPEEAETAEVRISLTEFAALAAWMLCKFWEAKISPRPLLEPIFEEIAKKLDAH